MNSALARVPAWQIAAGIRDLQFSSHDGVDAHFRCIHQLEPHLHAFVSLDEDRAKEQARRADEAIASRQPVGSLHGVPITIKSSIDVAGLLCETGTRLRQGNIATSDAPLVSRLKSAGAIVLGN